MVDQLPLGFGRGQSARDAERLDERRGHKIRRNIEQRAGVTDRFMALAVKQHRAAASDRSRQHGKDALRRAAGQEKAVGRIEIPCRGNLRVADRAIAQIQVARAIGFGEVDRKNLGKGIEQRLALVSGHVEPRGITGRKQLQRMEQRRVGERQQTVDLPMGQLGALMGRPSAEHGVRSSLTRSLSTGLWTRPRSLAFLLKISIPHGINRLQTPVPPCKNNRARKGARSVHNVQTFVFSGRNFGSISRSKSFVHIL